MRLWQIKLRAFSIHLLLSALVIFLFLLVATQIWYPGPLFRIENVWHGLRILIPVDLILGPFLTLLLFLPGKKGLKLDLSVIAAFQLAALAYGGLVIYGERPMFYAFTIDRFQVIPASAEYLPAMPVERIAGKNPTRPYWSYVLPGQTKEEKSEILLSGKELFHFPERHFALKDYLLEIKPRALLIKGFKKTNSQTKKIIEDFERKKLTNVLLFPFQATTYQTVVVVIDEKSGELVEFLDIDPWEDYSKHLAAKG